MKKKIDSKTGLALAAGIVLIIIIIYLLATNPVTNAPTFPPVASTTPDTAMTDTTSKPTQSSTPAKPTATKPAATPIVVGVGSLNELAAMKRVMSCSVSAKTGPKKLGTAYIVPGKFRVDLTNSISMIDNGLHYYAWVDGASTGLELTRVSAAGSVLASRGGLDPIATLAYTCYAWASDLSVFSPPSSIEFSNTY